MLHLLIKPAPKGASLKSQPEHEMKTNNDIINKIDFQELFRLQVLANPYFKFIELWIHTNEVDGEEEIIFIERPQNEYAQDQTDLITRVLAFGGEISFLWEGYAEERENENGDWHYYIIESDEWVLYEDLVEDCLENGDWQQCYDSLKDQIERQINENN